MGFTNFRNLHSPFYGVAMLVIGLTGGIGSGKTTVAKLFQEKGITVIDTDQLAREVIERGSPALESIKKYFGNSILNSDQSLNRNALRKIIFQNDEKRIWLEKLLHPLIRHELKKQIQYATSAYCIVVIPLLFETDPNPLIDRILVVDSSEENQINRTCMRDNSSIEEVKAILKTQVERTKRLALADDVIINNHSIDDLAVEVNKIHKLYTRIAQKNSFK